MTRRLLGLLAALVALTVVVVASIAVGTRFIEPSVVINALLGETRGEEAIIVHSLRIPRTVLGIVAGVALGVAGALIQALTRNPLADSGILGVKAGATFAVAIGVSVFGIGSITGYLWFAFVGALLVTVAVYVIGSAGRRSADPITLTLAGVAIAAVLSGVTTAMTLINPRAFDELRNWEVGSVAGRDLGITATIAPFVVVGVIIAVVVARSLNSIALGDDLAVALGTRVGLVRVAVVIAVTLLAGSATAAAGPILFLGLVIPHIARWIVGPEQRWILAYTIVLSPLLLLLSDLIGRVIIRPGEMPVGIVMAFVGAPVLIFLVRRRKASSL